MADTVVQIFLKSLQRIFPVFTQVYKYYENKIYISVKHTTLRQNKQVFWKVAISRDRKTETFNPCVSVETVISEAFCVPTPYVGLIP